jgi:hypothetical protein
MILILRRKLVLTLIWLDCIDIGLNIGCLARISKDLLAKCKDLPFMFIESTTVYGIFNSHSTVA